MERGVRIPCRGTEGLPSQAQSFESESQYWRRISEEQGRPALKLWQIKSSRRLIHHLCLSDKRFSSTLFCFKATAAAHFIERQVQAPALRTKDRLTRALSGYGLQGCPLLL